MRESATEKRREEFKQRIESGSGFRCELESYNGHTFAICRAGVGEFIGNRFIEHVKIYWVGLVGHQVIFDNTTNKQGFSHQHHIMKFYNQELSSEPTTATWD